MKKCPQCGKVLDNNKFNRNNTTKDGYYCYCRECSHIYKNGKYHETKKYKLNSLIRKERINLKTKGLKKCPICLEIKKLELFRYKQGSCRGCELIRERKRYNQNRDKINLQRKNIYQQNHDEIRNKINKHRYIVRDYRNEWTRKYMKNRMQKDIQFALRIRLRDRLNKAIKNKYEKGIAIKYLGCSIKYFKKYIQNKFINGMSWSNWGRNGWHLDHIKPLSLFNLEDNIELEKACHYKNLQPLWAKDNLGKGAKISL